MQGLETSEPGHVEKHRDPLRVQTLETPKVGLMFGHVIGRVLPPGHQDWKDASR